MSAPPTPSTNAFGVDLRVLPREHCPRLSFLPTKIKEALLPDASITLPSVTESPGALRPIVMGPVLPILVRPLPCYKVVRSKLDRNVPAGRPTTRLPPITAARKQPIPKTTDFTSTNTTNTPTVVLPPRPVRRKGKCSAGMTHASTKQTGRAAHRCQHKQHQRCPYELSKTHPHQQHAPNQQTYIPPPRPRTTNNQNRKPHAHEKRSHLPSAAREMLNSVLTSPAGRGRKRKNSVGVVIVKRQILLRDHPKFCRPSVRQGCTDCH